MSVMARIGAECQNVEVPAVAMMLTAPSAASIDALWLALAQQRIIELEQKVGRQALELDRSRSGAPAKAS